MGGISLVTKGVLGPIEGDVIQHRVCLPLEVDKEINEMALQLPDEIVTDIELPDLIMAEVDMFGLEVEIQVPLLDVTAELEG
jgi:hypothetical protein